MSNSIEEFGFNDCNDAEERFLFGLYEKIINGDLTTFESLRQAVSKYKVTTGLRKCVFKAFCLQKKLYWGFFCGLSPKKYPRLWKEIVLSDSVFRFGGDLKRSMTIPNIYLGLIDIHGYTRYCQDKKRNISMIDLLDRMIYEDVDAICMESGVLSKRAQGDEILLLGASAEDVLNAALQIMDYFNTQGRSFRNTVLSKKLPGTVLPKFQVSAGIAGGQKYTPLVITRDGDISGDVVNTAARLQAKANKISPDHNRIMITSHVYQKLLAAMKIKPDLFLGRIGFFNSGTVEFKGVSLCVYDIVFLPEQSYRLKLQPVMESLYKSLDAGLWNSKILLDALELSVVLLKPYIEDGCSDSSAAGKLSQRSRDLLEMNKSVRTLFNAMYYDAAIKTYSALIEGLSLLPGIDKIALDYLLLVRDNYKSIETGYTSSLDREIEMHMNEFMSSEEKEKYLVFQKQRIISEKIQTTTRMRLKNRKVIWLRTTDELNEDLCTRLVSAK